MIVQNIFILQFNIQPEERKKNSFSHINKHGKISCIEIVHVLAVLIIIIKLHTSVIRKSNETLRKRDNIKIVVGPLYNISISSNLSITRCVMVMLEIEEECTEKIKVLLYRSPCSTL